jgi:serine/threonine-protein kinase
MGEVYQARDSRLNRDVAVKILPEAFATDAERLARFRREAQVLASLNHPHIGAIYGFEESNGVGALVLELVEGPTLADRIASGPIPLEEAIPLARQITDACEAAHARGIIHRDLKPSNIKLRPDGVIKVLDFGLARAADATTVNGDASHSPTITSPSMTRAGVILGTASYMSPEQAKGRVADQRSDIWSFGCVLFEMITGNRAFAGEDVAETLAHILTKEPDWSLLPSDTPSSIRRALRRCLERDRKRRLADMADVRLELDENVTDGVWTSGVSGTPAGVGQKPLWRRAVPLLVTGVLTALIVAVAARVITRPAPPKIVRFTVTLPSTDLLAETGPTMPGPILTLSPDGTTLVYVAKRDGVDQLFARALDELEPSAIPGTDGARFPFFSPDGRWIGFQASGKLKKMAAVGGEPAVLCDLKGIFTGASWGSDGRIFFCGGDPSVLWVVPAAGGIPEPVTSLDTGEAAQRWPHVLPGAEAVVFASVPLEGTVPRLVALSLRTGERRVLLDGTSPRYSPTGHLLLSRDASLWAAPFDVERLSITGEPVPLLQGVNMRGGGNSDFAVAKNGTVAYLPGGSALATRTLAWVDRNGREEPLTAPHRAYVYPRISPDGSMLAVQVSDQENDIWVWDFARATLARLTFDPGADQFPVWTPDGRRIIYSSQREGSASQLYWQMSDGSGDVERLSQTAASPYGQYAHSVAPDGSQLVFGQGGDLFALTLGGERSITPLVHLNFNEQNGEISPDGRWLAYQSSESGRSEIYVRPFPKVDSGRWQVSTDGGTRPLWSRDGRELFFVTDGRQFMSVAVGGSKSVFTSSAPQLLSEVRAQLFLTGAGTFPGRTYDISADGRRFLVMIPSSATGAAPPVTQFVVILNWFEELNRLVP